MLVSGKGLLKSHGYQVATPTVIWTKQVQIGDFLARLDKAYVWENTHQQAFADALSKVTGLPPEVALETVKQMHPTRSALDETIVADADDIVKHLSAGSDTPVQPWAISEAFAKEFIVSKDVQ